MSQQEINKKNIKVLSRVDIAEAWEDINPILEDREIGYERETGRYKIGNGIDHWNDLSYASVDIVPIEKGGTGATDAETALENLGGLNKSGDTMQGVLKLGNGTNNGYGNIASNDKHINIVITGNSNSDIDEKTRYLSLHNSDEANNIADALTLHDVKEGKPYKIYGEHNKPTINELGFLGVNPIGRNSAIEDYADTPEDTVYNWKQLGTGHAFYSEAILTDQPAQYGILNTYNYASEVAQTFQVAGEGLYIRYGNHGGWMDRSEPEMNPDGSIKTDPDTGEQIVADKGGKWTKILDNGNYNPNFETKRIFLNTNWEDGVQLTTITGSIEGYDLTKFYANYNYDLKIALDVNYLIDQNWDTVKCKNAFQDLELYSYGDHNKMIALGDIDTSIIIPILVTATKNIL